MPSFERPEKASNALPPEEESYRVLVEDYSMLASNILRVNAGVLHLAAADEDRLIVACAHVKKRLIGQLDRNPKYLSDWERKALNYLSATSLHDAREQVPPEVGRKFDAHGIAKGTTAQQFGSLIALLDHGIDPSRHFHSTHLRLSEETEIAIASAMGAGGPYANGGFIVTGPAFGTLSRDGVALVLVGAEFTEAIPILKKRYPGVHFIAPENMVRTLIDIYEQASKRQSI